MSYLQRARSAKFQANSRPKVSDKRTEGHANKNNMKTSNIFHLKSLCTYFTDPTDFSATQNFSDKFTGLKSTDGKLKIYFPVGYRKPDDHADEKEIRSNILNLIYILRTYGEKGENLLQGEPFSKNPQKVFPIHAYIFIIRDFLSNGYFSIKEQHYQKNAGGKINWGRTIKNVKPQFSDGNVFYLDFVTQKNLFSQSEMICKIHKALVYECFLKLGFLFTPFMPEKSDLKMNKTLFISVIKKVMSETFNENTLFLLKNMIDVLEWLDDFNDKKDFVYGTENFHVIWERMIDSLFGESDKEKFYPKVYWRLYGKEKSESTFTFNDDEKRNSLRPDTIMILNRGKESQKIFVLDAKYYRYGASGNKYHLPDSSSIVKQLAYAKYIEENAKPCKEESRLPEDVRENIKENTIFNAFIMPANLEGKSPEEKMKNIGWASADYVLPISENGTDDEKASCQKSWYKIHGILLDTKSVMEGAALKNKVWVKKLSDCIFTGNYENNN